MNLARTAATVSPPRRRDASWVIVAGSIEWVSTRDTSIQVARWLIDQIRSGNDAAIEARAARSAGVLRRSVRRSSSPAVLLRRLRSLVVVVLALVSGAAAQGEEIAYPLPPADSGWDWARLDTGEVIKGEMIAQQNDVMSFDSDKFDKLEIDWEDVVALRLARPRVFRRRGGQIYIGMGEVAEGTIRIVTPTEGPVEFPADEVLSIVFTREAELRNWRMQVGVNLAARSGNTDQADMTADAKLRRQTPATRWRTRYTGTFSQTEGDRTANNHRVTTQFDVQLTEHFFLILPVFEFFQDEFQNIDQRYTPGIGVGYEPIDTSLVEWDITVGPAAQITRFDGGRQDEDAAAVVGSALSFSFPHDIDLDLSYRLQLIATDLGKTSHSTSAILSLEIWGPLDLDVGGYMDRIEQPERNSDGQRPNRNDFRLTVGLSLDF
jgi:hypothetical protein